jgi:WD40 repeat protein
VSQSVSVTRGGKIDEIFDVMSAAFSADGRKILSCDAGRRVMVWDIARKKPLTHRFGICRGDDWGFQSIYATSATFSPKGTFLGIISRERAAVVRISKLRSPMRLLGRSTSKLSLGKWIKDPALDLALERPPSLTFSIDESLVAVPVRNEIRFLNTRKGFNFRTTRYTEGVRALAFSPRDTTWIAAGFQSGTAIIQDVESARSWSLPAQDRLPSPTSFLSFNAEGSVLGSISQNEIKLWDHRSKCCTRLISQRAGILAFPPSGDLLVTSDSYSGIIHIWDLRSINEARETVDINRTTSPVPSSRTLITTVPTHTNHTNSAIPLYLTRTPSLRRSSDNLSFDYDLFHDRLDPIDVHIENPQLLTTNLFLKTTDWTGSVAKMSEFSIGGGCFGDVFKGKWMNVPEGVQPPPPVAIKVIRPIGFDDPARRQNAFVVSCSLFRTL